MADRRLAGPVRIVGTGLLGTSIGLALTERGVDVSLADTSPSSVALAVDYGAGRRAAEGDNPELVIVCVPPDVTASVVASELAAFPEALVTDVASVKAGPLAELVAAGADVSRYIGSHPMAGRERSGAISARADIFLGRPWVIAGHDGISYRRAAAVEQLALDLGAIPIEMTVEEHDRNVALVSHVPQVVASLLATRLGSATDGAVSLAGQGLRDTTRIASSDPELWVQILSANSDAVVEVLHRYRADLDGVIAALEAPDARGSRRTIAEALAAGNTGVARIPGKHGQSARFSQLVVIVDDKPGELARLLTEIGEAGINMEDLRLEHSPGAQIGLAEISVVPEAEDRLAAELTARGWRISELSA
ncbi:prephenate dehydrogenase [Microbacteriaceae bacterium SG_E_30_P1]|uniref:Prephenate dehydrogenase n=1 Tax=Antiquaquibacter oligotrophicus TaxID=2880260 RepID=A0ABT6KL56_9MICO|nr:prephenate dehydrogenase [Antiquaquibacter oligotrophicus]MDH6180741.1 prephenate dehydrogenase [Antiquaquibacter oligotrophicus]UDF13534.1 prephenate dehydrogenase [Antiquaquibacter oligotrophicus]